MGGREAGAQLTATHMQREARGDRASIVVLAQPRGLAGAWHRAHLAAPCPQSPGCPRR